MKKEFFFLILCILFALPLNKNAHAWRVHKTLYTLKVTRPHYVCFDGTVLRRSIQGFAWHARRGCFVSPLPCYTGNAAHYAYFKHQRPLSRAYARCRHEYPFMLGQMQTH